MADVVHHDFGVLLDEFDRDGTSSQVSFELRCEAARDGNSIPIPVKPPVTAATLPLKRAVMILERGVAREQMFDQ